MSTLLLLTAVECWIIVASVIGWAIAIASGQLIYAAVPVSVSLLLNLLNRLRLEQRIRRRITAAINQLHRQILEENHSLYEKHPREAKLLWNRYANASLQTQRSEYLSQQASDHESSYLNIIQLKAQLTSLEQFLTSVVQYLNSSSLAASRCG